MLAWARPLSCGCLRRVAAIGAQSHDVGMSVSFSSVLGSSTAMSSLRSAMAWQRQGMTLASVFPGSAGASSGGMSAAGGFSGFMVSDQLLLTGLTRAGLTDVFGQVVDKPLTGEDLAGGIWDAAGWSEGGSSMGLLDMWG